MFARPVGTAKGKSVACRLDIGSSLSTIHQPLSSSSFEIKGYRIAHRGDLGLSLYDVSYGLSACPPRPVARDRGQTIACVIQPNRFQAYKSRFDCRSVRLGQRRPFSPQGIDIHGIVGPLKSGHGFLNALCIRTSARHCRTSSFRQFRFYREQYLGGRTPAAPFCCQHVSGSLTRRDVVRPVGRNCAYTRFDPSHGYILGGPFEAGGLPHRDL